MSDPRSFFWHDYETFGTRPALDRAAQFAGIRTDLELNLIGDPVMVYCRPANDFLPSPTACLVTGISPQHAWEEGLPECDFIAAIEREMRVPGTCTLGYNNIRFDDEFTRHLLYRNFFDPYAREWRDGNSRWDLLDVVRITRALRPEGLEWPVREDGTISNLLEDLTRVNGIEHGDAHDALADVHATIEIAKRIRQSQPRLYHYLIDNRGKKPAATLLNTRDRNMLVHTSGMFPNEICNTTLVMPICSHPRNTNGVLVFDLRVDPTGLIEASPDDLRERIFSRREDLPNGSDRIPIKTVHSNRCPVLAPRSVLDAESAQRIDIDVDACHVHRERILQHIDSIVPKLEAAHSDPGFAPTDDPDLLLYGGDFFSSEDRRTMDDLRDLPPSSLAQHDQMFSDPRIPEMLFRYRARNYLDTLDPGERDEWVLFCKERIHGMDETGESAYTRFLKEIAQCRQDHPERLAFLDCIEQYAHDIATAAKP
ncbi:MAG: exodeoxyribonuclease I [Pseudomonadota bacterium]